MNKNNNNYKKITVYELNLLYLDYKYNHVSLKTLGNLQNRAKVVNEYLGNIKVRNLDSEKIEEFYNYMLVKKKWKYKHRNKISEVQIANILSYLDCILEQAIFWKIILVNPIREKVISQKDCDENNEEMIKKKYELLTSIKLKEISDTMDNILKN